MKKLVAVLLTIALVIAAVCTLVACGGAKSDVEKAIAAAQKMSLAELEEAAKAEFEAASADKDGVKFQAHSLTSGIEKVVAKFIEKYDWAKESKYYGEKGAAFQETLNGAVAADSYIGDFVMIQDAGFVDSMVQQGFLLSYVPSGDGFEIAKEDRNPLVGVTFNKVFIFNKIGKDANYLKNVWQLTGKDGTSLEGRKNVSFQSPLSEDINESFLVMLTSPEACKKLSDAYKSYFGKDYVEEAAYKNIGYKFVAEFLSNIMLHKSDTDEAKAMCTDAYKGADKIAFVGVAKFKDYQKAAGNPAADAEDYYGTALGAAGLNVEVEGLSGFTYNMWTLIPKTAKMPYTACLFVRFLMSQDGFNAGWKGNPGYYSANTLAVNSGVVDKTLAEWKAVTIGESISFIRSNSATVKQFVTQQMNLRPAA